MRTVTYLALALAAIAFAAGSLPGVPDGPACLYAGTDIGITADSQGNCPSVTTWRLSQAEPVLSGGKYSYLHCQYERKRNGEPAIDLGNMRECKDVLFVYGGQVLGGIYFHDGHDMRDFYGSPCHIIDQTLKHSGESLRQLPNYLRQLDYRLKFPWTEIREGCKK